jgi:NTE family protein
MERPRTALVLGGGGSKGALQAGFYRAIHELGIKIDLVVAASVGALNGAFIAAGMPPRLMMQEWARVHRKDILSFNWELLRRGTSAGSLYTFRALTRFLEERLPVRTFEELRIPFIAVTTDLQTGQPYLWEQGDLLGAILASCAVPGIYPPVRGPQGRWLIDGALADNVPVATALARGADRVAGVLCQTGPERPGETRGIARLLGRAFGIATDRKWQLEAPRYNLRPEILIIDPVTDVQVQALDFSRGGELAQVGYRTSRQILALWLEELSERSAAKSPLKTA